MTYTPSEQQQALIDDAAALGARALVKELGDRATQLASTLLVWDGTSPEPTHYRTTWFMAFRHFLDNHKAGVEAPESPQLQVVTSIEERAALDHERRQLATALQSALDVLTDTELREYLDGVIKHLQRQTATDDEG